MTTQEESTGEVTPRPVEGFKAIGFFTADHAVVESGKVYTNGAYWNTMGFPVFPVTLPPAAVVAVIQVPWHANNHDHVFSVEFVDSDGHPVPGFQVQGSFRGSPSPHMKYGDPGVMPVAIPLFGVQLERPGEYSFVLKIDGDELARYKITVLQVAFPGGIAVSPLPPPSPTDF